MLSVATAPVDARQRVVAIGVIIVLTATTLALIPAASTPLPAAPAGVPFLLGIALAAQLVTAYLLMSQFVASRVLGTAFLAGAYLVGGLSVLAYVLTFPGVTGIRFGLQVAPWTWIAWHVEFPLAVCAAVWFDRDKRFASERADAKRWMWGILAGAVLLVGIPTAILVIAGDALPAILRDPAYRPLWRMGIGEVLVLINVLTLALAVLWTQGRTVLHMWLIVALVAAALDVQISLAGGLRFTLGWYAGRTLVVCSSAAVLYAYLTQMHALFVKLRDLSMIDGLTELPNRRYFEMRVQEAIRAAHRSDKPLAVLIADVDAFKQYNDTYGHLAGDEALKKVATTLRLSAMRAGDVIARWGGEEFIAFLAETDGEGAYLVAERLRAAVAAVGIPHRHTAVPGGVITISLGIATLGGRDDEHDALIRRADAALYRAKNSGRNTVAVELSPPRAAPVPV